MTFTQIAVSTFIMVLFITIIQAVFPVATIGGMVARSIAGITAGAALFVVVNWWLSRT